VKTLLEVNHLTVSFFDKKVPEKVLDQVSFTVNHGEIVGIVGESGSGKSMTSLSIMGLLSEHARILSGEILWEGTDLLSLKPAEVRKLKGSQMSMIFQEPMTSLNPVLKIGPQVGEVLKIHTNMSDDAIKAKVFNALQEVGLSDAASLYHQYPHQLSGGMRQRVMIAIAALNTPKLLIADEATTALDVTVQAEILRLLKKIHEQRGSSILFISHDLNVIKEICQKVIVMYEGKIVEAGAVLEVLNSPKHAYTKRLVASMPGARNELTTINPLLKLTDLNIFYKEKCQKKHVIKDLSLEVYEGEILGIVGESGCGKSTLARTIAGLHSDYEGDIKMAAGNPSMIFQDPYGSLNPAKKVGWILEEPLKMGGITDKRRRRSMVEDMLTKVGMDTSVKNRYPRELSGGQRQRVSIGCALINHHRFIIADEPVSSLDVTIQSQILDLLIRLHKEYELTIMFISHDLNIVRHLCHRVVVMYLGEIVETAWVRDIYDHPWHPYTQMLFDSILTNEQKATTAADSSLSMQTSDHKDGCCFYHRCQYSDRHCQDQKPKLRKMHKGHLVKCHKAEDWA